MLLFNISCGMLWGGVNFDLLCSYTSSWNLSDDYVYPGATDNEAFAIEGDALGNIYSTGYSVDSVGTVHLIVRKSANLGASWGDVDNYVYPGGNDTDAFAFGVDALGNLYSAGQGKDGGGTSHYIVRKSSNLGASWVNADDYIYPGGPGSEAEAFGVDALGNLYSAGVAIDGVGTDHLIVRKSSNSGASWGTVDDYVYPGGTSTQATGFGVDASGDIYTSGIGQDGAGTMHFIVRKSSNSGASWANVDDYVYPGGTDTEANAFLKIDVLGNLYSAGFGKDGVGTYHLIVRKSTNLGVSWANVDDYVYPGGTETSAVSFGSDVLGNLYSAGYGRDGVGTFHLIVRKSTNSGVSWANVDDYVYPGGTDTDAYAFGSDVFGNIYSAGYAADSVGTNHLIARKQSCN
jgi:hypothetical protein